ncbi:MAG: alpha/beta hydrolase [Acidimicrobiia bacterium]
MTQIDPNEGILDPYVAAWFEANPMYTQPMEEIVPEILELARSPIGPPPTREIAHVHDETIEHDGLRVPVRVYRNDEDPTAVLMYFHGGGFILGSIGIMDNVARELCHHTGAVVVSVEYRLAPEHPYPAGLDDCVAATRWAAAHAAELGAAGKPRFVSGESAGGTLTCAVALRLRGTDVELAGQIPIYPAANGSSHEAPSFYEFDGLVISRQAGQMYWAAYSAGRDLDDDPCARLLSADTAGLPPALVILGGADLLRDDGRAYAQLMRDGGVEVDEVCYPGQPHGFVNFDLPAAADAHAKIGSWLRDHLD